MTKGAIPMGLGMFFACIGGEMEWMDWIVLGFVLINLAMYLAIYETKKVN